MKKWYLTRGWPLLALIFAMPCVEAVANTESPKAAQTQRAKLSVRTYMDRAKKYKQSAASLAPKDAALQWLSLLDDYQRITTTSFETVENTDHLVYTCYQIITALPPSEMWEAIDLEVKQRADQQPRSSKIVVQQMLLALLQRDLGKWEEAKTKLVNLIQTSSKLSEDSKQTYLDHLRELEDDSILLSGDIHAQADDFWKELERLKANQDRVTFLTVPNLAAVFTPDQVFRAMAGVFKHSDHFFIEDESTLEMLKYGYLKHPEFATAPPWEWVTKPTDKALYERIAKQFPELDPHGLRKDAEPAYLLALIEEGNLEKASEHFGAWFQNYGELVDFDFMAEAIKTSPSENLFEFLQRELLEDGTLPWWSEYTELALLIGQRAQAMEVFMQAREQEDLDEQLKLIIDLCYAKLLVSVGHMDRGAEVLKEVLKNAVSYEEIDETLALQLVAMGKWMKEPSWEKTGLDFIKSRWDAPIDSGFAWTQAHHDAVVAMSQSGQVKVAEAYVERVLSQLIAGTEEGLDQTPVPQLLSLLVYLKFKTDRFEEVVQLIDESPHWGCNDLSEVEVPLLGGRSLQSLIVETFIKLNQAEKAQKIAEEMLEFRAHEDEGYRWIVELKGKEALPMLENQAEKHPSLSKPWSWKAHVLSLHGEDPQAAIDKALALNPLDDLAWATRAEVLEKSQELETAKAIRLKIAAQLLGREADEVYAFNLIYEASRRYEQAIAMDPENAELWAKAGLAAATLGEVERAKEHFGMAFRKLPKTLAQLESPSQAQLFESLFRHPLALEMAVKTLKNRVQKEPDNPKLGYVWARVLAAKKDVTGALKTYEKVMQLAPNWPMVYKTALQLEQEFKRLDFPQLLAFMDHDGRIISPLTALDPWRFKLAELDPWDHVGGLAALSDVKDLKGLWDTILRLASRFPEPELREPLYPLTGSVAAYLGENPGIQSADFLRAVRPTQEQLFEVFGEHQRISSVTPHLLQLMDTEF